MKELAANGHVSELVHAQFAPATMSANGLRIAGGIAEEIEEEGLGEGVELGEGGAALGPQRFRPVQHLRNPPLLGEGRQGKPQPISASRLTSPG